MKFAAIWWLAGTGLALVVDPLRVNDMTPLHVERLACAAHLFLDGVFVVPEHGVDAAVEQ